MRRKLLLMAVAAIALTAYADETNLSAFPTTIQAANPKTMAVGEVTDDVLEVTVAEFNAAEVSTTVWYKLTGIVRNLKDGEQYGNFDLEDETGSVYVYGLLSEKGGAKKQFQQLAATYGITNGSQITIIGNRGVYNGKIEALNAYYVSDEEGVVGEASSALTVTYSSGSTINYAQYTGTLDDGSILGFYFYNNDSYAYFCGAITTATSIVVPEKVSYNGKEYTIRYFGYNPSSDIDFDEAPNIKSLTLPSELTYIYNYVPASVSELHLLGTTPPSIKYSSYISSSTAVYVPQSAYATYQSLTTNSNSNWYGVEIHYEGWEPQSYTVTVNTPGTFGNILLSTGTQWTDVYDLTVIGHLNTDDLKLLTRLKYVRKLNLSQTDITVMKGCKGLTRLQEVLLPSTVTEVDSVAFYGCSKLKEIIIPNATSIGDGAFSNCSSLTMVSLPAATSIGSLVFVGCSSLSTVSLPAATSIGLCAFPGCSSLTMVSLPAATSIGDYAFSDCNGLNTVSLPAATSIGDCAFRDCNGLNTVSLPAAISIGSNAFLRCSSLSKVDLPAATSIGSYAFRSCSSLSTVDLPAATSIGSYAFEDCRNLTTVSLSDCLQSLGNSAFVGCSNLQDVYCRVVAPLTTTAFSGVGSAATLHVPAFSRTSYMLHDSWYFFYQIVALEELLENLTINSNFTITDYSGLADKVDLSIYSTSNNYYNCGHLTISADTPLHIGRMFMECFNWKKGMQYPYCNSLITQNEVTADQVIINLPVVYNQWNFHSFPFDVKVCDISVNQGTLWVVRRYSGADRAALTGNTWQNMTNDMILKAGEGYIFHCANEESEAKYAGMFFRVTALDNEKKNNIFTYSDVVIPLNTYNSENAHNRSWNLVGNPYPSYYNTNAIEHNGVITVWNGHGYSAYSLLDDDYQLRPNEAFFVQCPVDATSMTFKAEGRTHEYKENDIDDDDYYTRSRVLRSPVYSNRMVYNFMLSSSDFSDHARLVINPNAKMDYEISCDASKFMSDDPAVPQLYVHDNGIRYAIDERPLSDGIITLGARFGQTGEYTIALKNNPAEDMSILLIDNETDREVNIAEESYTFTAQAGTSDSRFTLQIGNETTGIVELTSTNSQPSAQYDLQGRRTNNQSQKGIYIIRQNGKSRKVMK